MSNLTWPTARMAKFIDVTPRRLQQLVQEGVVPKCEGRGRYNPIAVNLAYIRFLRDRVQSPELSESEFHGAKLAKIRSEHEMIKVQTRLLDSKLAEQNGDLLPVAILRDFLTEFFVTARAELRTWKILESARMALWFKLHDVFIAALRECGFDTAKLEAKHQAEVKQFKTDLAGGHIPDDWRDPLIPEEHGRVWSRELSRYYSKQEIIERFGEGTYISPIDEVLDWWKTVKERYKAEKDAQ